MTQKQIRTFFILLAVLATVLYYGLRERELPFGPGKESPSLLPKVSQPATEKLREGFSANVIRVIDGDTIVLEGGERVRYIGMDTPEHGRPFFLEAKRRNEELVKGKTVWVEGCHEEPRDKYGRLLAYIYVDELLVNAELLKEGYAKQLLIPPCGVDRADEFRSYVQQAKAEHRGIWEKR